MSSSSCGSSSTKPSSYQRQAGEQSSTLGFLRTRDVDFLVNLLRREAFGPMASGFFSENPEHFRLRAASRTYCPDAERYRFGRAALLDDP